MIMTHIPGNGLTPAAGWPTNKDTIQNVDSATNR